MTTAPLVRKTETDPPRRVYGPHQQKWGENLYFKTPADRAAHNDALSLFDAGDDVRRLRDLVGALYTQALYTDRNNLRAMTTLHGQAEIVAEYASELAGQLDAYTEWLQEQITEAMAAKKASRKSSKKKVH